MGHLRFVVFQSLAYWVHIEIWMGLHFLGLLLYVNHLLKLEWGFYYKGGAHETSLSQWSGREPWSHDAHLPHVPVLFLQTKEFSGWNIIDILCLKHPKDWFHTSFDMFLKDCDGTFRVFVWTKCLCLMKMDYWAEHANNKWLFGHILWTLWNKSGIYLKVSEYLWCNF